MRDVFVLAIFVMVSWSFYGCNSEPDTRIVFDTSDEAVLKSGLFFGYEGGNDIIHFKICGTDNPRIKINCSSDNGDSSWVKASCDISNSEAALSIECQPYDGFLYRYSDVNVSVGYTSFTIQVSQQSKPQILTDLKPLTVLPNDADDIHISLKANGILSLSFNSRDNKWLSHTEETYRDSIALDVSVRANNGLGRIAVMTASIDGKKVADYIFRQQPAIFRETVDITDLKQGQLCVLLGDDADNLGNIRTLTLSGKVNALDLYCLRQLRKGNYDRPLEIDMSDLQIYPGDDCFYPELDDMLPNNIPAAEYAGLPDSQFAGFRNLSGATLPVNLVEIGQECFSDCSGLRTITIPESVGIIRSNVFSRCQSLEHIVIGEQSKLTTINDMAFSTGGRLKKLTLPATVTYLSENAFSGCSTDSLLLNWQRPPVIEHIPDTTGCILFVPEESAAAYRQTPNWNRFKDIREIHMGVRGGGRSGR